MISAQSFTGYIPKQKESWQTIQGVYKFKSDKRHHWLQRLCFWILDRLGCQYKELWVEHYTPEVSFDSIVDLVMTQRHAVHAVHYGNCKYLILGREQMYELRLASEIPERQMLFHFPTDYKARRGLEFAGMAVILVPWFDGIVCLDELR